MRTVRPRMEPIFAGGERICQNVWIGIRSFSGVMEIGEVVEVVEGSGVGIEVGSTSVVEEVIKLIC